MLLIAAVGWRAMSKEERLKVLRTLDVVLTTAWDHGREDMERFRPALRARLRWPVAAPALAALNVAVFLWILRGHGVQGGPVVAWGASFGPLTSNGEWWRVVTSIFLNARFVLLIVNVAALVHLGLTLERVVGSAAFAAVFLAAGILSGLAELSRFPTAVMAGPSGAIFGLYGLALVVGVGLWRRRSELAIPLAGIERFGATAMLFAGSNVLAHGTGGTAQLVGLSVGILFGLAAARESATAAVPPRRAAAVAAVGLALAVVSAISLRGILDVRPEIERVLGVESRTAESYRAAAAQFKNGRMTAEALAGLIDQSIVPELQAADSRIGTLHGVPAEDASRMAAAREYLRLRSEGWRLRAEGLRLTGKTVRGVTKSDGDSDVAFRTRAQTEYQTMLTAFGKADGAERASLDALGRLQELMPAAVR